MIYAALGNSDSGRSQIPELFRRQITKQLKPYKLDSMDRGGKTAFRCAHQKQFANSHRSEWIPLDAVHILSREHRRTDDDVGKKQPPAH